MGNQTQKWLEIPAYKDLTIGGVLAIGVCIAGLLFVAWMILGPKPIERALNNATQPTAKEVSGGPNCYGTCNWDQRTFAPTDARPPDAAPKGDLEMKKIERLPLPSSAWFQAHMALARYRRNKSIMRRFTRVHEWLTRQQVIAADPAELPTVEIQPRNFELDRNRSGVLKQPPFVFQPPAPASRPPDEPSAKAPDTAPWSTTPGDFQRRMLPH